MVIQNFTVPYNLLQKQFVAAHFAVTSSLGLTLFLNNIAKYTLDYYLIC